MRRGILFSITAVVLAFSVISLIANYRLFLSQIETDTYRSPEIQNQFLYTGYAFSRVIDIGILIQNINSTTTTLNITDRLPRDISYGNSLSALDNFTNNKLKSGNDITTNFSSFNTSNQINFTGINMKYTWGSSTKPNVTINFTNIGLNSFVKSYTIVLANLTSYTLSAGTAVTLPGDLSVTIKNSTTTFFTGNILRSGINTIPLQSSTSGKWVNFTIGLVGLQSSSVQVVPTEKVQLNTTITVNQGEIV